MNSIILEIRLVGWWSIISPALRYNIVFTVVT